MPSHDPFAPPEGYIPASRVEQREQEQFEQRADAVAAQISEVLPDGLEAVYAEIPDHDPQPASQRRRRKPSRAQALKELGA